MLNYIGKKWNKIFESKMEVMKHHEGILTNYLFNDEGLQVPTILYGKKAADFLIKNAEDGELMLNGNANGCFIRAFTNTEGLSEKDIKLGVVCMLSNRVETLAHEMRHAYQWQTNKSLFPNNEEEKEQYREACRAFNKKAYYYQPAEQDAFLFALQYLNGLKGKYRLNRFDYQIRLSYFKNLHKFCISLFAMTLFLSISIAFLEASLSLDIMNPIVYIGIVVIVFTVANLWILDKEHYQKLEIGYTK